MKRSVSVVLALLAGACAGCPAGAQSAKTREAFDRGPHSAPAEQCVVGITTRFRGRQGELLEERHSCGVLVRCDGFVIFSAAALDHRPDQPEDIRPSISVTLRLGAGDERAVSVGWPKAIPAALGLRLVKLAETHAPAARTLLPAALKPGDALTAVWLPWDGAAARFGPVQSTRVHLASGTKRPNEPWSEVVAEALDGAPAGTVLVGPEGMLVGMRTARPGEDARRFVSMEALPKVTNCVTPLPTLDAQFASRGGGTGGAQPEPAPTLLDAEMPDGQGAAAGGMVKVPGGPVILPASMAAQELEMDRATVACVPPFQIDRLQVTNREYWEYWSRLPDRTVAEQAFRRLARPLGWAEGPTPFPPDIAALPVLGASYAGAEGYARSRGKRLPTPYEWALAALGPDGDTKQPGWLARYAEETNGAALRIKEAHLGLLRETPMVHGEDFLLESKRLHSLTVTKVRVGRQWLTVNADQRIHGADFMIGLPWIISPLLGFAPELQASGGFFDALGGVEGLEIPLRLKMQAWSRAQVAAETAPLLERWKDPHLILPVGSREFDSSPCGARDMIWNGGELVAPPATAPAGLNGFAVGVTMLHPQEKAVLDELLLVSGPNGDGVVEAYPDAVPFPLSRLVERTANFPVAQWLWFHQNLQETRDAMRLISGWHVNMQPATPAVEVRIDNHSPFVGAVFYDNYPLYREWARPPRRRRPEIGSALTLPAEEPLPTPIVPRDSGAALRFLVPIGFRCAR